MGEDVSILKENSEVFADCCGAADEQCCCAHEESAQERRRVDQPKIRKCLICKSPFQSAWAGERICRRCKSTSGWRSGALG
jgi:hypothetical protein